MKTIHKYPLGPGYQLIETKRGGQLLSAQAQNNQPQLWILVDPEETADCVEVKVVATGVEFEHDASWRYIDTFQLHQDRLVFHVFAKAVS